MKRTKIVATIGPASDSKETILAMANAGMNVARLNMKHGTLEYHGRVARIIKEINGSIEFPLAIMIDIQGPEIRVGQLEKPIELKPGQQVIITSEKIIGSGNVIPVTCDAITRDVNVGDHILMSDGLIDLEVVEKIGKSRIKCKVIDGGILKSHKGVNIPGVHLDVEIPTERDKEAMLFGIKNEVDYVAVSFTRNVHDVLNIREFLDEHGGSGIGILAKIENKEGVENIDKILPRVDGIMVARGDLGVEISLVELPLTQKTLIKKANESRRMVITATEMLNSMIEEPIPTRAEVTDVVNAVLDGSDALMLSGETAVGKYPVKSVETMAKLAERAEKILEFNKWRGPLSITAAMSYGACDVATKLKASSIICATVSGRTAINVSAYRPDIPIYAVTVSEQVRRKLSLAWGVYAYKIEMCKSIDTLVDKAIDTLYDHGKVKPGDIVVITAGVPLGKSGMTNTILVRRVGIASNGDAIATV